VWLDFAAKCGYMSADEHVDLMQRYDQVIGSLVTMVSKPEGWCGPSTLREERAAYTAVEPETIT
jgi:hypothetical protein